MQTKQGRWVRECMSSGGGGNGEDGEDDDDDGGVVYNGQCSCNAFQCDLPLMCMLR